MKPLIKYKAVTAGVVFLFLYVLCAEIPDRWRGTLATYQDLMARQEESPESIASRRFELEARKRELASRFTRDAAQFDQSETGVVEFLNATARRTGSHISAIIPASRAQAGQIQEIGFTLHVDADFHTIARFVNGLEQSGMLVRINSLELSVPNQRGRRLEAAIEGSAFVIPLRGR